MYSTISSIIVILKLGVIVALKDGDIYRFTSVPDEHVITMNVIDSVNIGNNITIEPWQDGSNQKWLAVEAIVASDSYFLIPKRQSWNWSKFAKGTTKDRKGSLPDNTNVMAEGMTSGLVVQQPFDGRKYQQWKSVDAGHGKHLIKSMDDDKCVYNPGQPKNHDGVLTKIKNYVQGKEKLRPRVFLSTANCNATDENQQWIISLVM